MVSEQWHQWSDGQAFYHTNIVVSSNGGGKRNKIWHKGSLGDEADAHRTEKACSTTRDDEK